MRRFAAVRPPLAGDVPEMLRSAARPLVSRYDMNTTLTDLTIVLDRSGSIASIRSDMEGGLNTLLRDQAGQPGTLVVSLFRFDNECERVFEAMPVDQVRPIVLQPRGSTALLDAIGVAIDTTGKRLAAMDEAARPGKVIVVIVTDGEENASRLLNWTQARERIVHQRDAYQWQFIFLGANIDAIGTASQLAIGAADAMTFTAKGEKVTAMAGSLSTGLSRKRAAKLMSDVGAFTAQDRAAQED